MVDQIVVVVEKPAPVTLVQVAKQGPPGPIGLTPSMKTLDGEDMTGSGDVITRYVHQQISPSSRWSINHNLGKFPSVSVVDSSGSLVIGEVLYLNNNSIQLDFNCTFSGTAFLN